MTDDFLRELGHLSLATRLKRLSDRMIHSGREMYKSLELDIEPNWYMIFKLLQQYERLSVTEISSRLQLSHPSIISIIEKMTKKGFLQADRCEQDGRKQLVSLTKKALEDLPFFEEVWKAGIEGVAEMDSAQEILSALDELEDAIAEKSFKERTLQRLKITQQP